MFFLGGKFDIQKLLFAPIGEGRIQVLREGVRHASFEDDFRHNYHRLGQGGAVVRFQGAAGYRPAGALQKGRSTFQT